MTAPLTPDPGCPRCDAPPEEMCRTASGKVRNDHVERRLARAEAEVDRLQQAITSWEINVELLKEEHAAEVDRLRAQVATASDVLRDLDYPNPEADQDWTDDPVGCIRDALRAALASLASGDEVRADRKP